MKSNLPVLPVAIRGSRALLRDTQWFPRRGPLVVTIGKPIQPPVGLEDFFAGAIRLRDAAREEILTHCGEPEEELGSQPFVESVRKLLGIRAKGRDVIEGSKGYQLREEAGDYRALFEAKNSDIGLDNAYLWNINA